MEFLLEENKEKIAYMESLLRKSYGEAGFMDTVKEFGNKAAAAAKDGTITNAIKDGARYVKDNIKVIIEKIIEQIKAMIKNLIKFLFNKEKDLRALLSGITKTLSSSAFGDVTPENKKILTAETIANLGIHPEIDGSRCKIAIGYLETVTKQSILEGIDKKSIYDKSTYTEIYQRLTGQSVQDVNAEQLKKALVDQLYVFQNLEKDVAKKSLNSTTQTVKKSLKGSASSLDVTDPKELEKYKKLVSGENIKEELEKSLGIIKMTTEKILNYKALEFLNREYKYVEAIKRAVAKSVAKQQQTEIVSNKQQGENLLYSELMRDVVKAGYGEGILKNAKEKLTDAPPKEYQKGNYASGVNNTNTSGEGSEANLMNIFLVEYSKALNNAIQNINKLYQSIIVAGKSALDDYRLLSRDTKSAARKSNQKATKDAKQEMNVK